MSSARLAPALALLGCGALGLAAWLFLPRSEGEEVRPGLRALLVDVSLSATRFRPDWLSWVRGQLAREAREAAAGGEELLVVSCAAQVGTVFGPGEPRELLARLDGRVGTPLDPRSSAPDPRATRLAAALERLEPALDEPRRATRRLVLLGPGTFTGPDPAPTLARLLRAGVSFERRDPGPALRSDLALLGLELAPRVEQGAPIVGRARLAWRGGQQVPGRAWLSVEVSNGTGQRELERELVLPLADGVFELPVECGPAGFGRTEVRLRAHLAAGPDALPENDTVSAGTRAEGSRVIGVVAPEDEREAARAWLTPQGESTLVGLEFLFLTGDEVAEQLSGCEALISFDVPLEELPRQALESFVLRGGGWLAISGWRFLRDWIPGETSGPLHRLLPLEPLQGEQGPRDVVLLLDGSGSMAGEPFETVRAAALDLVASALPSDRVSLRFFTVALEPVHLLKRRSASRDEDAGASRRAADELLALRVPRGTTFLLRSLQQFGAGVELRPTLALLITDGWDNDALPDERGLAAEIAQALERAGVQLTVIAVGQANTALLSTLAGGSDRVLRGETLEDLRAIFHRELLGSQLASGSARGVPRAPGSLAADVLAPGETQVLPPLERYVRNGLRPGAELLWESDSGEPLLGLARAGLGRTALFASRPSAGWASGWAGRAGLGEPSEFDPLLRWLVRGPDRDGQPRVRLEQERLVVEGLDPGTPARLQGRLFREDAQGSRELGAVELLASARPGRDPLTTREGRVPETGADGEPGLAGPGLVLFLEDPQGAWALPVRQEPCDELAQREEPLRLPALAGGAVAAGASGVAGASHPAAPWVLGLGLAALLVAALRAGGAEGGALGEPGGRPG